MKVLYTHYLHKIATLNKCIFYLFVFSLLSGCTSMQALSDRGEIKVGMDKAGVAEVALFNASLGDDPWLTGCFYEPFPKNGCEIIAGKYRKSYLVFCGVSTYGGCDENRRAPAGTLAGIFTNYIDAKNSIESKNSNISQGTWSANQLVRPTNPAVAQISEAQRLENERKAAQLEQERIRLAQERERLDADKLQREKAKQTASIAVQASASQPDAFGEFTITIRTNADTSSLKLNGDELGGKADGVYTAKRVARAGQETKFTVVARDLYGNTDTKVLTVSRPLSEAKETFAGLNAANLRPQRGRDAVAIIIGIQDYLRVPKAEFAKDDAQAFYDYALRLGIRPDNINMMLDSKADDVSIVKAFKNWLPSRVTKDKTDVYVFFSGHGLPSDDGKLYLLPYGVDKDLLERTAVAQKEVVNLLQAARPKSVTMFIDSCYSGQTRGGEQLLASARPVSIMVSEKAYPDNFTVMSASASSQISSSSPDLKHGIFSYYLMKGLEGDADDNKDGTITIGKLQSYLSEKVPRFAMKMNRTQEPQLVGDSARVLVSK